MSYTENQQKEIMAIVQNIFSPSNTTAGFVSDSYIAVQNITYAQAKLKDALSEGTVTDAKGIVQYLFDSLYNFEAENKEEYSQGNKIAVQPRLNRAASRNTDNVIERFMLQSSCDPNQLYVDLQDKLYTALETIDNNQQQQDKLTIPVNTLLKAPLHDASETISDNELVSNYSIQAPADAVSIDEGTTETITVTFSGSNLKAHTNGAGTLGYWMGLAVPDTFLLNGYTVKNKRGFGNFNAIGTWDDVDETWFDPDPNIAPSGKWCSFYREVGQAQSNNNKAYSAFKYTKDGITTTLVIVYDYSNVTVES